MKRFLALLILVAAVGCTQKPAPKPTTTPPTTITFGSPVTVTSTSTSGSTVTESDIVSLSISSSTGGGGGGGGGTPAPTDCNFSLRGSSQDCQLAGRTQRLHMPPSSCSGALPLVLYLHGGGGDIYEGDRNGDWLATADKHCYVEVNAAGLPMASGSKSWNSYNAGDLYSGTPPDDVWMLKQVVATIEAHTPIDTKAIFATGISAGGYMAARLGVDAGDVFAAVYDWDAILTNYAVGSSNGLPSSVNFPVHVAQSNGRNDTTVPICGTNTGKRIVESTDFALDWWKQALGCTTESPTGPVCSNGQPVLSTKTLSGCRAGSSVTWTSVANVGHSWYWPLSENIWTYFNAHRRP